MCLYRVPLCFFFILYSCDFISFEMCLNLKKINILFVKSLVLNDMRKKCSVNMISFLRDRQIAPKKPIICAANVESTQPETTRTGWFSGLHYGWFWTWHNQKCCTKCNKKTKHFHSFIPLVAVNPQYYPRVYSAPQGLIQTHGRPVRARDAMQGPYGTSYPDYWRQLLMC